MIKKRKAISVIIPNYNYADFIEERIDSVLNQTYQIDELIILDDASTDNSVEVIQAKISEIEKKYPNLILKFIKNQQNSGGKVFSQWQKGLCVATGDYFWIAEADDSCHKDFLKTAMEKLEKDDNIKIFFSDSKRINQNGKIISPTCTDMTDMWKCGHWDNDYVEDGEQEIKKYLSGQIFILNVSSVVWKNEKRCLEIFKEAEKYKVAGDWYIYSRILEEGKIAYSSKALNYFRKHNKGSASTLKNRTHEYEEVLEIQERIRKKYSLNRKAVEWQKIRRRGMGFTENEKNCGTKGDIAWLVPWFSKGSGGHRTIFQNANFLIQNGYKCDLYVDIDEPGTVIYDKIREWYGDFDGDVYQGYELRNKQYDIVFATGWDTAKPASLAKAKNKLYFIQDYEPWFFSRNENHIAAEKSYQYGLNGVTIGKWLAQKINRDYNVQTNYFNFCADTSIYYPIKTIKKEKAVCLIFQPGKPRRCDALALRSLEILQKLKPDIKIYLYGSSKRKIEGLNVEHLGIISTEQCNELYNKCSVGLSMSASNPSRIPFEMMAAGLPVVDLYVENNLYDLPDSSCLLAEPSPEAIASALIYIIDHKEIAEEMSKNGIKFMKDYPLQKGFDQFLNIVNGYVRNNQKNTPSSADIFYKKNMFCATPEVQAISKKYPSKICLNQIPTYSEIAKIVLKKVYQRSKHAAGKILRKIYRKLKYGPRG